MSEFVIDTEFWAVAIVAIGILRDTQYQNVDYSKNKILGYKIETSIIYRATKLLFVGDNNIEKIRNTLSFPTTLFYKVFF